MLEIELYVLYALSLTSYKPYERVEISVFMLQMKIFDAQVN